MTRNWHLLRWNAQAVHTSWRVSSYFLKLGLNWVLWSLPGHKLNATYLSMSMWNLVNTIAKQVMLSLGGGTTHTLQNTLHVCYQAFSSNNFATSVALEEVCALLSAILFTFLIRSADADGSWNRCGSNSATRYVRRSDKSVYHQQQPTAGSYRHAPVAQRSTRGETVRCSGYYSASRCRRPPSDGETGAIA